jgi:hypothetical protein
MRIGTAGCGDPWGLAGVFGSRRDRIVMIRKPLVFLVAFSALAVSGQPLVDILLNDPATDFELTTQSETSIVVNGDTVCAAWNDSGSKQILRGTPPYLQGGFSGFGVSTDGGVTFIDGGAFPVGPGPDEDSGDPSLAYSVRDDTYYYAALSSTGLSLWSSTDGCQTFGYVGAIHASAGDDKELIAVDNDPASPYYGRIHIGWTDFAVAPDSNLTSYSDDGGSSWSAPVPLPGSGGNGQGMWPAVAPGGNVYFAVLNRSFTMGGLQDQWIYESTDGGDNWVQRTDIATDQLRPENTVATARCGRQALNGDIRNLSSPQIVIHADPTASVGYVIHATYPYDSDGAGPDESNVFYRRSTDGAVSWSAEVMLNDDGTNTDQFYPAIGVNARGTVVASWYDRRLDSTNNLSFDRYAVVSTDGGLTFGPNIRISDVTSPLAAINPNFDRASNACVAGVCELFGDACVTDGDCFNPGINDCYHGDYDQVAVDECNAHIIWSDDRRITATGPNPDVYHDRLEVSQAPLADAGPDQVLECQAGGVQATLDGTGSSDPDGDPLAYLWEDDFVEGGGTATGPNPTVTFEGVGEFEVNLTVEDTCGLTDTDTVTISVIDTTPPEISCNSPATITPPDAPISFTATATDQCEGPLIAEILGFDCFTFTKRGKRIDKTESCVVSIDGDRITIDDSGGVTNNITWTVAATDVSGNSTTVDCALAVINPGRGN